MNDTLFGGSHPSKPTRHGWFSLDGNPDHPLDILDSTHEAAMSFNWASPNMLSSSRDMLDWGEELYTGEVLSEETTAGTAGTAGGQHARRMMAQTLTWQGAYVVGEPRSASPRTKSDEHGRLNDEATFAAIASLTHTLLGAPSMTADDVVRLATVAVNSLGIDVAHVAPPD